MSASLSLMLHLLYIISVFTLLLGGFCWLISPLFINWTKKFDPLSRLVLLRSFGAVPLTGALFMGAMVSVPALSHISTLPIDHCHSSSGCFGPPASHMVTAGELVVISIVLCLLLWGISTAFLQWRRSNELLKRLHVASQPISATNVQLVESALPLAFTLGIFKPVSVLSTGLMSKLSPRQLDIVCAHEAIHMQCRDGLYKWILRFMCSFHWPNVKRIILTEHAISLEIRADQHVALNIQNNIAVAETIVKVQRLMTPLTADEPLCQFLGSELEQRVHYLLSTSPSSVLPKHSICLGLLCSLVLAVCGSVPLHNAIEVLITIY